MFISEDPYKIFQESLGRLSGKLHILDASIPIEEQGKYFALMQRVRQGLDVEKTLNKIDALFDPTYETGAKKVLMVSLAIIDKVEAYRALEKYAQNPDEGLRDWAALALEESRMTIERSLSEEEQVFISTGLGGRGDKFRFLAVFYSANANGLTEFQQKTTRKEIEYILSQNGCEVEQITVYQDYVMITALYPYQLDMKALLNEVLTEINQYGNFLMQNYVMTNVKIFNQEEILRYKASFQKEIG